MDQEKKLEIPAGTTTEPPAAKEAENPPITEEQFPPHIFEMLNVYLTEWCHRDNFMQKEVFTYFYAALVVILAPYTKAIGESNPKIALACYYAGYMLALCVVAHGHVYANRLSHVGNQYRALLDLLPAEYRDKYRIAKPTNKIVTDDNKKVFHLAYADPLIMAICLSLLNYLLHCLIV